MTELVIACLSQKGGVGKSTLARLIARTYASAGWNVKIADFNTNQLTSGDWVERRTIAGVQPPIRAESYNSPKQFKREIVDMIVADGKPDSDQSSLEIAKLATLCVIPTGLSYDDLKPQVLFANELTAKGVDPKRILIVLNKIVESQSAVTEGRAYLRTTGYNVAEIDISVKVGYQNALNAGRALSETTHTTLNTRADALAAEIVDYVNQLSEE